jgi:hypothetical protein
MKNKLVKGIAIVMMSATFMSCSKSYNCHCVYKTDGTITHEDDSKINEGSKSKSDASCKQQNNTTTSAVGGYTSTTSTECELT